MYLQHSIDHAGARDEIANVSGLVLARNEMQDQLHNIDLLVRTLFTFTGHNCFCQISNLSAERVVENVEQLNEELYIVDDIFDRRQLQNDCL